MASSSFLLHDDDDDDDPMPGESFLSGLAPPPLLTYLLTPAKQLTFLLSMRFCLWQSVAGNTKAQWLVVEIWGIFFCGGGWVEEEWMDILDG